MRSEIGWTPSVEETLRRDPHGVDAMMISFDRIYLKAYPKGFAFDTKRRGASVEIDNANRTLLLLGASPGANPTIAEAVLTLATLPRLQNYRVEGEGVRYPSLSAAADSVRELEHEAPIYSRVDDEQEYRRFRYRTLQTLSDFVWYHTTRTTHLPSIRRHGLMPSLSMREQGEAGWSQLNVALQDAVYLTSSFDYAMSIADTLAQRFEEDAVVLKVTKDLDPRRTIIDEDALRDAYDGMIASTNLDPRWPSFISSVVHDVRSIGYQGTIAAKYLRVVGRVTAPIYEEVVREDDYHTGEYELTGGLEHFADETGEGDRI